MSRAGYVTIEGVDSVGKTTLTAALCEHYRSAAVSVVAKPEFPADPAIRNRIEQSLERSIFVGEGFAEGASAAFFYMLYAEAVALGSLPAIADLIIGDRGIDSLCLYQGFAVRGRDRFDSHAIVTAMETLYTNLGLRLPDRTILLTLRAPELECRFRARNRRDPTSEEMSKLVWLQEQYLTVAVHRARFTVLEGNSARESILKKALQHIER